MCVHFPLHLYSIAPPGARLGPMSGSAALDEVRHAMSGIAIANADSYGGGNGGMRMNARAAPPSSPLQGTRTIGGDVGMNDEFYS